jgi:hypothetical protein
MDEKHELSHECPLNLDGLVCVHCEDNLLNEQQVATFAVWLDSELAKLDKQFEPFVTQDSLRKSLRSFFGR